MLLAPTPELSVRNFAQESPKILGGEVCRQCDTRSPQQAAIETDGLGRPHGLAMRAEEEGKVDGATG